jgi:hypothetical protein
MDDQTIRRAVLDECRDSPAPPFDAIAAGRVKRRVRKLRAGAAFLVIVILSATASFVLRPPERNTDIALLQPPTTDWLLRTPDPAWVEQLGRHSNEEPSNVR